MIVVGSCGHRALWSRAMHLSAPYCTLLHEYENHRRKLSLVAAIADCGYKRAAVLLLPRRRIWLAGWTTWWDFSCCQVWLRLDHLLIRFHYSSPSWNRAAFEEDRTIAANPRPVKTQIVTSDNIVSACNAHPSSALPSPSQHIDGAFETKLYEHHSSTVKNICGWRTRGSAKWFRWLVQVIPQKCRRRLTSSARRAAYYCSLWHWTTAIGLTACIKATQICIQAWREYITPIDGLSTLSSSHPQKHYRVTFVDVLEHIVSESCLLLAIRNESKRVFMCSTVYDTNVIVRILKTDYFELV